MATLSTKQKDELEEAALMAFGGTVRKDLAHGVRTFKDKAQVSAVYFSDNEPGNDVEIAFCESRLTEHYDLKMVHAWIRREQAAHANPCNTHKHGSDWPIIGLSFAEATQFFARCRKLRLGRLPEEEVAMLRKQVAVESPEEEKSTQIRLALSSLRPTTQPELMDLVRSAGIDVSGWSVTQQGVPVAFPNSNPNYCFNWAFGGRGEPAVVCLWHEGLIIQDGMIVFNESMREVSRQLSAVAADKSQSTDVRSRARRQARGAQQINTVMASAWNSGRPVRVIVNEGRRTKSPLLGITSSSVSRRKLDPEPWYVHAYDIHSGQSLLVRAVRPSREGADIAALPQARSESAPLAAIHEREGLYLLNDPALDLADEDSMQPSNDLELQKLASPEPEQPGTSFVDQHTLGLQQSPLTKDVTVTAFVRSRAVRDSALARAQGFCELCGEKGFRTANGSLYLETHHVIPLAEGGTDNLENVVALCPNDHRRAHFGTDAASIRKHLMEKLARSCLA